MDEINRILLAQHKRDVKKAKRLIIRDRQSINGEAPKDLRCHCVECTWRGYISDCPTEPDPIGFMDGPWYDMQICPNCGAGVEV